MQGACDHEFFEKAALALGAGSAKVIPADRVVVEDRVRLRCAIGCPSYPTFPMTNVTRWHRTQSNGSSEKSREPIEIRRGI